MEVKTTLRVQHIKYFLENLKKFSSRLSVYRGKIIYGAVAYLRAEESANKYVERQGLFVIRATGDSASIINKKEKTVLNPHSMLSIKRSLFTETSADWISIPISVEFQSSLIFIQKFANKLEKRVRPSRREDRL
ncbi:MAG: hypothetical protein OXJ52_00080 [Oligoflexia bacterium]|nr:hypothetical protein [Oligoflexia bacterium]